MNDNIIKQNVKTFFIFCGLNIQILFYRSLLDK